MKIKYKKYGDKGVLVQWPAKVNLEVLDEMQAFIRDVKNTYSDIKVIYHAYHEVYIEFVNLIHDFTIYKMHLQFIYQSISRQDKEKAVTWIVPVCYDVELVPDLTPYLETKKLELDEFIHQHTDRMYNVYFTGFLPGFLYLGGLAESLAIDRKQVPSKKISKGTVAIGGKQTGIYPQDSPGGWYGVGYTPIPFFDPRNNENPTWAKPGDQLQFKAISSVELEALENDISLDHYTFQAEEHDG